MHACACGGALESESFLIKRRRRSLRAREGEIEREKSIHQRAREGFDHCEKVRGARERLLSFGRWREEE